MAAPNIPLKKIQEVRDELNKVSPSFCLAKWLQVTVHLQNGQTHSCHHPKTHKVPLHEIQKDPSALHNTFKKKLARKDMIDGLRPSECEYCWKIEDAHQDNLSDRSIKSSQKWSIPRLAEIKSLGWADSVVPSYLEVSFGNECNFRCAYCAPMISSSIMKEFKEFGPYSAQGGFAIDVLKEEGLYPIPKDDPNPYVDAFWQWWPSIAYELKVFRITGGEPLLNSNTFKFLEYLKNNPLRDLTLGINSNLGIPDQTYNRFLEEIKHITSNKSVKEFQLFTSVDTFGKNAEFVRFGLNYEHLIANIEKFLQNIPECELIIMCTYNAFSVANFRKFLEQITILKSKYLDSNKNTRLTLDIPYLKDPNFISCYILTDEFLPIVRNDIQYLKNNAFNKDGIEIYYQTEISKLERILHWMEGLEENEHRISTRKEFSLFLKEYLARKSIKAEDYIPEYLPFIKYCNSL